MILTQTYTENISVTNIGVYENSLDEFDIGDCPIKVKVTARNFTPFTTIQTAKSCISALPQAMKL